MLLGHLLCIYRSKSIFLYVENFFLTNLDHYTLFTLLPVL